MSEFRMLLLGQEMREQIVPLDKDTEYFDRHWYDKELEVTAEEGRVKLTIGSQSIYLKPSMIKFLNIVADEAERFDRIMDVPEDLP